MRNEDYFNYIKERPFADKLRAFADAMESMVRHSYEASNGCMGGREWHENEYKGQRERVEFLFKNLIEENEQEQKPKEYNTRETILLGMNAIITNLNNEDTLEPWLMCGVPDGADTEEICEMANDDTDFKYSASLFLDIIRKKSAWNDGLYVSEELGVITADSRKED